MSRIPALACLARKRAQAAVNLTTPACLVATTFAAQVDVTGAANGWTQDGSSQTHPPGLVQHAEGLLCKGDGRETGIDLHETRSGGACVSGHVVDQHIRTSYRFNDDRIRAHPCCAGLLTSSSDTCLPSSGSFSSMMTITWLVRVSELATMGGYTTGVFGVHLRKRRGCSKRIQFPQQGFHNLATLNGNSVRLESKRCCVEPSDRSDASATPRLRTTPNSVVACV